MEINYNQKIAVELLQIFDQQEMINKLKMLQTPIYNKIGDIFPLLHNIVRNNQYTVNDEMTHNHYDEKI